MSATLLSLPFLGAYLAGVVSVLLPSAILKWPRRDTGASRPPREEGGGRLVFEGRCLVASEGSARTAFNRHPSDGDDWDRAVSLLDPDFPHLDSARPPIAMDCRRLVSADGRKCLSFANNAGIVTVTVEETGSAPIEVRRAPMAEDPPFLADAVRSLPLPVWVQDEDGNVSWVNSAYLELCENARPLPVVGTWPLPEVFESGVLARAISSPTRSVRVTCSIGFGNSGTYDVRARRTDQGFVFVAAATDASTPSGAGREEAIPGVELARWVRSELEMCQAVIDGLDDAVAVFDTAGGLAMTNAAYDRLWGAPMQSGGARPSLNDVTGVWIDQTAPTPTWSHFRDFARRSRHRTEWAADVVLRDGRPVSCRFSPLAGGATLAAFRNPAPGALRAGSFSRQSA